MKSRLDDLLRQRELLREHTRWLEDEIAAEQKKQGADPSAIVPAEPAASERAAPAPLVEAAAQPAAPLPEPDIKGLHSEVRRGCVLYFLVALLVFGALVAIIYWRYSPGEKPTPASPEPAESLTHE